MEARTGECAATSCHFPNPEHGFRFTFDRQDLLGADVFVLLQQRSIYRLMHWNPCDIVASFEGEIEGEREGIFILTQIAA
jgi:hypothetical protein